MNRKALRAPRDGYRGHMHKCAGATCVDPDPEGFVLPVCERAVGNGDVCTCHCNDTRLLKGAIRKGHPGGTTVAQNHSSCTPEGMVMWLAEKPVYGGITEKLPNYMNRKEMVEI